MKSATRRGPNPRKRSQASDSIGALSHIAARGGQAAGARPRRSVLGERQRAEAELVEAATVASVVSAAAFGAQHFREALTVGRVQPLLLRVMIVEELPRRTERATSGD